MGIISKLPSWSGEKPLKITESDNFRCLIAGVPFNIEQDVSASAIPRALSNRVFTAAFSPDGSTLVLGGDFAGNAKVYSVSGPDIAYASDIYTDTVGTALGGKITAAAFSPDGTTLVLAGDFTGIAKVYSVNGHTITYAGDIYADANGTVLSGSVSAVAFSTNGAILVLGGDFAGSAKLYSVSGQNISYVRDIHADVAGTALDGEVAAAVFSPDNSTLMLGGNFVGHAKLYSINGLDVIYVCDIYANSTSMALDGKVVTAAFSSASSTLILGGDFTGHAKIYTLNGSTITYVGDIYADTIGTALNGRVSASAFSFDGSTLVLGGGFAGSAKAYSVSQQEISNVGSIYADGVKTELDGPVAVAAFSSSGNILVIGGNFSGSAKRYIADNILPGWTNFAICTVLHEQNIAFTPEVVSALLLPNNRGDSTLDIYICTTSGIPEDAMLSRIMGDIKALFEPAISAGVNRSMVKSMNVTVGVTPTDGYESAAVRTAVQTAIRGWFNGKRLGRNVLRAELGELIFGVEGVANYKLTTPGTDVVMTASQLPRLGTLTVVQLDGPA